MRTNFALDYLRTRGYSTPAMLVIGVAIGMITGLVMRGVNVVPACSFDSPRVAIGMITGLVMRGLIGWIKGGGNS